MSPRVQHHRLHSTSRSPLLTVLASPQQTPLSMCPQLLNSPKQAAIPLGHRICENSSSAISLEIREKGNCEESSSNFAFTISRFHSNGRPRAWHACISGPPLNLSCETIVLGLLGDSKTNNCFSSFASSTPLRPSVDGFITKSLQPLFHTSTLCLALPYSPGGFEALQLQILRPHRFG